MDTNRYFVVEGRGEFPRDMLRYDECVPLDQDSSLLADAKMGDEILEEKAPGSGRRTIRRYEVRLASINGKGPTTKRWESFGFRVIEIGPGLFGELSEKRPRGRPRVHPDDVGAADRARIADERLVDAGGTRRTIRLSVEASKAADEIVMSTGSTFNETVARLLLEEVARLKISPG